MTFKVANGVATGWLKFLPDAQIPESALTYLDFKLYNCDIITWYDLEQNVVLIKMTGSIISMMQFRKIILLNFPDALDE